METIKDFTGDLALVAFNVMGVALAVGLGIAVIALITSLVWSIVKDMTR